MSFVHLSLLYVRFLL